MQWLMDISRGPSSSKGTTRVLLAKIRILVDVRAGVKGRRFPYPVVGARANSCFYAPWEVTRGTAM